VTVSDVDAADSMVCRACGQMERASEGYPCAGCGTFICLRCEMRGVAQCRACAERARSAPPPPVAPAG
jgi:hypothetical protein